MDGRKDVGIKPTQEESKNRSSENGGRAIMNYVAIAWKILEAR